MGRADLRGRLRFPQVNDDAHGQSLHPGAVDAAFRGGREAISEAVYPRLETFYDDLTAAYRAEIADLAARGLRDLQFDDTNLAYLCDPDIRARTKARGDDPDALVRLYCRLINDLIRDRPADMTMCVHLCRGNFKSAWVAQGGYEPVAEILLNEMKIDGFFLEYDDERSGDLRPSDLRRRARPSCWAS